MHDLFTSKRTIVISCSPHIVPYLKQETEAAGFPVASESWTTVQTTGTFADCIRLNLLLRTANHVFLLIKKFTAATLQQVYDEVKAVEWEEILFVHGTPHGDEGYFSVHSVSEHAEVTNFMFMNMKVKDAIADRFVQQLGKRPDSGSEKNKAVIFLHWKNNECSLYLDTSGESLTKHGYRKIAMKAPLQESLAAAMISATRWDAASPFINPMCGSGTLAIEAALMAVNKPPGLIRTNFGFMHVKGFDSTSFLTLKKELEEKILPLSPATILATDNDRHSLDAAKQNARMAGVEHLIRFVQCEFEETPLPSQSSDSSEGVGNPSNLRRPAGIVIFNPPYGERLGVTDELKNTYAAMGNFLKKKCAGYFGYIFTANPELAKNIGLKPSSKKTFLNGTLECRLLEFEIFEGSRKDLVMNRKK
ncbi:MAG TPA: class I SAM-dependent RNA methyltransferase [Chitinophagales bacterium]|nr:class I SAM-dependent RNA methyltransferase [Chitinophagales bacterium]